MNEPSERDIARDTRPRIADELDQSIDEGGARGSKKAAQSGRDARAPVMPRGRDARAPGGRSERHAGPSGWHSRGYLPHFEGDEETVQAVTFRLADSLPRERLDRWQRELAAAPRTTRQREIRQRINEFLDRGTGACELRDPRVAGLVQDAILHFDNERYRIHAWVVMPNHVHVVVAPSPGFALGDIVQSWKSFTSKKANTLLSRKGRLWQPDYFDRYIRDDEHFERAINYVEENPVRAGLCRSAADWPFSSARCRLRH